MIKKIVVFGLGWQGKQFVRYFIKNKYEVFGICKTEKTKKIIEEDFGISVYNDFKLILNNDIDYLILSAYPIGIYKEILEFSRQYNYKILVDLPVTFDINLLKEYVYNKKIEFFLLETKNYFFKNYHNLKEYNIENIECLIFQNKDNLKSQTYKKESIIVDTQYVLNNLLLMNLENISLKYKFINRIIKDIEYLITIKLKNGNTIIYKYENGKGINIEIDSLKNVLSFKEDKILFDNILDNYIINDNDNDYKKQYYHMYSYLLKKFKYEK